MLDRPIIVVGAARSGTKYLRDILATARNACKVPYDINYIWRYGHENFPDDALPAEFATPRTTRFVRAQIARLSGYRSGDDRVIFEKTVGTSLRVAYANAIFPEARFIHLVRDGRAVTESAMRQWEAPPDWRRLIAKFRGLPLRNLGYAFWFMRNFASGRKSGRGGGAVWGPRYPGIDEDLQQGLSLATICARQWRRSVEFAQRDLVAIDPDRVVTTRYEDLVGGEGEIRRLAKFCGLRDIPAIARSHVERVERNTDDKWAECMSPQVMQDMFAEIGPLLAELGYGASE